MARTTTYRDVTLSMPVLRSSRVQALRMALTSSRPLAHSFPDVFRRRRANSPSLSSSWCCCSWRYRDKNTQLIVE